MTSTCGGMAQRVGYPICINPHLGSLSAENSLELMRTPWKPQTDLYELTYSVRALLAM
jgi:hypothetical protein